MPSAFLLLAVAWVSGHVLTSTFVMLGPRIKSEDVPSVCNRAIAST